MMDRDEGRTPGVRELDHTADLGIEVHGASLPQLFDRTARGMFGLIRDPEAEGDGSPPGESATSGSDGDVGREIALDAPDLPRLMVRWLRELLYVHEMESRVYRGARFEELTGTTLRAGVRLESAVSGAVREIKGVTYHDLEVTRKDGGWRARIIFDV